MNVKELFEQVNQDAVIRVIQSKYPEEKERIQSGYYENLIGKMKEAEAVENEEIRTIHVEYTKDFGVTNPEFIWNASYSTHKRHNHKYSLKFASMEEIASSYVMEKDLEEQSVAQYFAHLLFEMAHGDVLAETEGEFNCIEPGHTIKN
jgi:hypothetical protein